MLVDSPAKQPPPAAAAERRRRWTKEKGKCAPRQWILSYTRAPWSWWIYFRGVSGWRWKILLCIWLFVGQRGVGLFAIPGSANASISQPSLNIRMHVIVSYKIVFHPACTLCVCSVLCAVTRIGNSLWPTINTQNEYSVCRACPYPYKQPKMKIPWPTVKSMKI